MKINVSEKLKPVPNTRKWDPYKLSDEEYHDTLALHNPIWRYIVSHYTRESECPIVVLGRNSLPIAIELSQWSYPMQYLAEDVDAVYRAQKDCQLQAGDMQRFFDFDFVRNCPQARVVCFTFLPKKLTHDMMLPYFSMLLRTAREVVFCVEANDKRVDSLLDTFDVSVRGYHQQPYLFISVREYETQSTIS